MSDELSPTSSLLTPNALLLALSRQMSYDGTKGALAQGGFYHVV